MHGNRKLGGYNWHFNMFVSVSASLPATPLLLLLPACDGHCLNQPLYPAENIRYSYSCWKGAEELMKEGTQHLATHAYILALPLILQSTLSLSL